MAIIKNNFEGGTNGTTITSANSGGTSGSAVSGTSIGTGNTLTYDNTQAAGGSVSANFTYGGTAQGFMQWLMPTSGRMVLREYFRLSTAVSGAQDGVGAIRNVDNTADVCAMRIDTDGKLMMYTASATSVAASKSSAVLAAATWYRLEMYAQPGVSTTDGLFGYSYYAGDSTTALFTYNGTGLNAGTTAPGAARVGRGPFTTARTIWFDSIALSDQASGLIGPETGGTAPIVTVGADQTKNAGDLVTLTSSVSGSTGFTRSWAITSYPTSLGAAPTLSSTSAVNPTFTATAVGRYVCTLTVTDTASGLVGSAFMKVFVPAENVRPVTVVSTGGWTTTGVANAALALADELTTTYTDAPLAGGTQVIRLNPMTARTSFSMTLNHGLPSAGSGTAVVNLKEGTATRKTWTVTPSTTFADVTLTMTSAECATIGSWLELDVELSWA